MKFSDSRVVFTTATNAASQEVSSVRSFIQYIIIHGSPISTIKQTLGTAIQKVYSC